MRILTRIVLFLCLAAPATASPVWPPQINPALGTYSCEPRLVTPLLASAQRESTRLVLRPVSPPATRVPGPANSPKRQWISRHPVLFGTLVGAGAGAVASVTMENELFCSGGDEDCFFHGGSRVFVGTGFGAGVGALVGWIAGLGSK
jgi:hypothetical protein